ncbi:MAG TPA: nucleotidyltransferase [Firmicutes bacterium]|nr:nucleotidyltransferase [Bacillota bacterium]
MTAEHVLAQLEAHAAELRAFGVRRIGVFGSVARGEATDSSDLDLLVDLKRHTFDDYFGALNFLEDLFGCKVDLVQVEALKDRARPTVLQDLIYVEGI